MPLRKAPLPPTPRRLAAGPCRGPLLPLGPAALPRLLARSAAGAAAGCAAVHGLLLAGSPWSRPVAGTAALAIACLVCAAHLWRDGGRAAWLVHAAMSTLMLSVHPAAGGHHGAGGLAAWAAAGAALLAAVALLLALARAVSALRPAQDQAPASPDSSGGRRVPQA